MSDHDDDDPVDEDGYTGAMNRLIDRAIDYMGRDRAVAIANSAPIRVDETGEIQEFQFGETRESKRAVAQLLLEAYVQVVGQQLVLNMLQASVSGQRLQTFENLCPADRTATEGPRVT